MCRLNYHISESTGSTAARQRSGLIEYVTVLVPTSLSVSSLQLVLEMIKRFFLALIRTGLEQDMRGGYKKENK
jgi:hypothetical protein